MAVSATALPVALLLLAPVAGRLGWSGIEEACRAALRSVCHQRPDRSFSLWGEPLGVCARCFGAWSGLLAGVVAGAFVRSVQREGEAPRRALLWALLAPAAAHPLLSHAGLAPDTALLRFATAFPAAAACGVVFLAAVVDLFESRAAASRPPLTGAPHAEA